jgi:hypothetical protein
MPLSPDAIKRLAALARGMDADDAPTVVGPPESLPAHALKLAEYRMRVSKKAIPCLRCGAAQVQLRDWMEPPTTYWRCRVCKFEWTLVIP